MPPHGRFYFFPLLNEHHDKDHFFGKNFATLAFIDAFTDAVHDSTMARASRDTSASLIGITTVPSGVLIYALGSGKMFSRLLQYGHGMPMPYRVTSNFLPQ